MTARPEADLEVVGEEDDRGVRLEPPVRFTSRGTFSKVPLLVNLAGGSN